MAEFMKSASSIITDKFNRPLRDLRVSVTDKCNFRCPYCMPAKIFGEGYSFLPNHELLSFEEISRLIRIFANFGLKKVRITGGEPLIRPNLENLVKLISDIKPSLDISLTTNGYLLKNKAIVLKKFGLHRLTVSLDTLDDKIFKKMNGRDVSVDKVIAGIEAAEDAGFFPIKINAVVQKDVNFHTILDLARFFDARGHILRFIEYMDVGTLNSWSAKDVVSSEEIRSTIDKELPLEPLPSNYPGEVASRYRYKHSGNEIGIISSITQTFCSDCTRLRMSPEGKLATCLFAQLGTDLKTPLRSGLSDDEIAEVITNVWKNRSDRYSELRSLQKNNPSNPEKPQRVEMYKIGG